MTRSTSSDAQQLPYSIDALKHGLWTRQVVQAFEGDVSDLPP
jgi:hypothetical protein